MTRRKKVEQIPELHSVIEELRKYGIDDANKALRYIRFHKPDLYNQYLQSHTQNQAFVTADSVADDTSISTGIECLDKLVGGLKPGSSYEIFGRYGSGKTQTVLSIIRSLLLHDMAVVYYYTEGKPPVSRITQMRLKSDKLLLAQVHGPDHMLSLLRHERSIASDVIVIDSFTGLFRRIFTSSDDFATYKSYERRVLQAFYAYIDTGAILVYTNQIYSGPILGNIAFGGHLLYHFSTYRIKVERDGDEIVYELIDAPDAPNEKCSAKLTDEGVK